MLPNSEQTQTDTVPQTCQKRLWNDPDSDNRNTDNQSIYIVSLHPHELNLIIAYQLINELDKSALITVTLDFARMKTM